MARITGIGGVFLRAGDADALAAWYRETLGIPLAEHGGVTFHWAMGSTPERPGTTTWALFPSRSSYLGRPDQQVMMNFRVDDLAGLLADLRAKGVRILDDYEESEFGRFAWCLDPEGNRVELWEPAVGM
ncbi:Catechol 2,3-dioxygenase [Streptoalloteichus tenebrarius]|uniref:Catechol 2,3-dioxygenase n=1 Tax=Streptoalloteichus tenebrarius (strain ATCC 17920 / DSM 40477 / JCM 4838 / CBS 697.72 / NBRC 16177 / NCIMB 11028 / NRRL B-12390 / A12253. 1 / ISP 5477) TaxID=1933 RepID=A0ABT1HT70_STRSD|nr:VOC family protein [Streptoalloteichus tenebrarius]MCP2258696.1 Catechol 2,3-dioxygenase [Streptoalloteichus tenebrarius]